MNYYAGKLNLYILIYLKLRDNIVKGHKYINKGENNLTYIF